MAEKPSAVFIDDRDLVVTQPIEMIFLQQRLAVIDQELSHFLFPKGEYQAARVAVAQKVQAVFVIPLRLPIEKVDALLVERAAGMVVNHIRKHPDAIEMTQINECL